jgi:hypothetical protein
MLELYHAPGEGATRRTKEKGTGFRVQKWRPAASWCGLGLGSCGVAGFVEALADFGEFS